MGILSYEIYSHRYDVDARKYSNFYVQSLASVNALVSRIYLTTITTKHKVYFLHFVFPDVHELRQVQGVFSLTTV